MLLCRVPPTQDKAQERAFFDAHAAASGYYVFQPPSARAIVARLVALAQVPPGATVADLGCGSGTFTGLLRDGGLAARGLDLCPRMIAVATQLHPGIPFAVGDVEALPYADASLDAVLLSAVLHHLPERAACLREVVRVLKPGGAFMAFDPNRRNPFLRSFRDPDSPLYNPVGVSPNERPLLPEALLADCRAAGLAVSADFYSPRYRHIDPKGLRWGVPVFNFLEPLLFAPRPLRFWRAFVLTYGHKPA